MNEQELAEIKERYAKLGDEDANVIHRLLEKIEQLNTEIGLVVKEALADQALLGEMIAGAGQVNAELKDLRNDNARLKTELYEARRSLGKAAMEINVAGPVDHRIRILRTELNEAFLKVQAENARLKHEIEVAERLDDLRMLEIANLRLRLAQANAALGIVDPALGTGAFLTGLENPPYGEKDGEG